MNIERILQLADYIEYHPEKFNMSEWMSENIRMLDVEAEELYHMCGTSACIAGHAVAMFRPDINLKEFCDFAGEGKSILGLDDLDGAYYILFNPSKAAHGIDVKDVTNLHAAKCLRHLAATGKVDWIATKPTRLEIIKNKVICYMLDFFR